MGRRHRSVKPSQVSRQGARLAYAPDYFGSDDLAESGRNSVAYLQVLRCFTPDKLVAIRESLQPSPLPRTQGSVLRRMDTAGGRWGSEIPCDGGGWELGVQPGICVGEIPFRAEAKRQVGD